MSMILSMGRCPACKHDVNNAEYLDGMEAMEHAKVCDNEACKLYGLYLTPVNEDLPYGGHEMGKTYWCGYWQDAYTVSKIHTDHLAWQWLVESKWHGDKRTTTHSTSLEAKWDCEVSGGVPHGR